MIDKHEDKFTNSNELLPYDDEYYFDEEKDDIINEELGVIPFAVQNSAAEDSGDESFTGLPYVHRESRKTKKDGKKNRK